MMKTAAENCYLKGHQKRDTPNPNPKVALDCRPWPVPLCSWVQSKRRENRPTDDAKVLSHRVFSRKSESVCAGLVIENPYLGPTFLLHYYSLLYCTLDPLSLSTTLSGALRQQPQKRSAKTVVILSHEDPIFCPFQ